jgi:hypothetical protein
MLGGMDGMFITILIAYVCYMAWFIYRSSFVIDGERYFSLFDDAMISMRYAKNLAHGYGLVWNPGGERVEGYTNPLWTLFMALVHLLPVKASKISLVVQIVSGLLLIANLFFVRKIAGALSNGSRLVALSAVFFTAFYYPLNTWSLLGMEVGLLILLTTAAIWKGIEAYRQERFSAWPYLLLGLGTLVRMDMAVPFIMLLGFNLWSDRTQRRRHLQVALPLLMGLLLAQTAARWFYYGDILPNTYYLKMTGYPAFWRIMRGLLVLGRFIWQTNWLVFAIPFIVAAVRRDRSVTLPLLLASGQMLYSVYVGGDAWENWVAANRYISIAMPGFLILVVVGIAGFFNAVRSWLNTRPGLQRPLFRYGLAAALVLSFANLNANHGVYAFPQIALVWPPLNWGENFENARRGHLVDQITEPGATVAVSGAGVAPYFFDRTAIDQLGKSDRVIGHMPMHTTTGMERFTWFWPGHLKWDNSYVFTQLKPDVVIHVWEPKEAQTWLDRDYRAVTIDGLLMYLRKDSRKIRWAEIHDTTE